MKGGGIPGGVKVFAREGVRGAEETGDGADGAERETYGAVALAGRGVGTVEVVLQL